MGRRLKRPGNHTTADADAIMTATRLEEVGVCVKTGNAPTLTEAGTSTYADSAWAQDQQLPPAQQGQPRQYQNAAKP